LKRCLKSKGILSSLLELDEVQTVKSALGYEFWLQQLMNGFMLEVILMKTHQMFPKEFNFFRRLRTAVLESLLFGWEPLIFVLLKQLYLSQDNNLIILSTTWIMMSTVKFCWLSDSSPASWSDKYLTLWSLNLNHRHRQHSQTIQGCFRGQKPGDQQLQRHLPKGISLY
jgi:hypothetical protein